MNNKIIVIILIVILMVMILLLGFCSFFFLSKYKEELNINSENAKIEYEKNIKVNEEIDELKEKLSKYESI